MHANIIVAFCIITKTGAGGRGEAEFPSTGKEILLFQISQPILPTYIRGKPGLNNEMAQTLSLTKGINFQILLTLRTSKPDSSLKYSILLPILRC